MTVYGAENLRHPVVLERAEAYRCQECFAISEDIEVLMAYRCESCDRLYEDEYEARVCCEEEESNA